MRTIETGGRFRRWLAWWLVERRRKRRAAALPPGPMVPSAPTGFLTFSNEAHVWMSWDDMPDEKLGYRVYRKWAFGGDFELVAQVGSDVVSWEDWEVEIGVLYVYRVVSYNAVGESLPSVERHGEALGA